MTEGTTSSSATISPSMLCRIPFYAAPSTEFPLSRALPGASGKEAIISRMRRGRPWVGPAVRQFPDPRVEPFLTELMEGTITLLRRSRSAPGLREKGTAAKSRLLRIATRGWIDPLGLVSWLLRLTLRQLPHRPSPHISALQKIQEQGMQGK